MFGFGPGAVDGEADGKPVCGLTDVSLLGSPVAGLIGDVVPNGCELRVGDGVPLGDCGATVDGDPDGGSVDGGSPV